MFFVWSLLASLVATATSQCCDTITVSNLPADCVQSPCGTCDLSASEFNGDWVRISDLTNQQWDPLDEYAGKMPVYTKMAGNQRVYLFYDAFYAYSLSGWGESEGWAIGTTVGSVCTDDWGYCRCGNAPAACCSTGCNRYLAKQSEQVSGTACQDANSYNRQCPDASSGNWKTMRLTTGSLYSSCTTKFSTNWGLSAPQIQCALNQQPAQTAASLGLNFGGSCALDDTSLASSDCRTSRCQGCMYAYNSRGCQDNVDSCQCNTGPTWTTPPTTPPASCDTAFGTLNGISGGAGTASGGTYAFTCSTGFTPSGVATCTNGEWDSPTCIDDSATTPPPVCNNPNSCSSGSPCCSGFACTTSGKGKNQVSSCTAEGGGGGDGGGEPVDCIDFVGDKSACQNAGCRYSKRDGSCN